MISKITYGVNSPDSIQNSSYIGINDTSIMNMTAPSKDQQSL